MKIDRARGRRQTSADCAASRGSLPLLLTFVVLSLAGCSAAAEDPNAWYNMTVMENLAFSKPASSALAAQQVAPPAAQQVAIVAAPPNLVPETELYRSEASCGGVRPSSSRNASASSIALEMTECEVARLAGSPDKIELGANQRGERVLTMTYGRSDRARVYRFASGRLVGVEIQPFHQQTGSRRR